MKLIVGDRQTGKTQKLVEWVKEGEHVEQYPYWSRVILSPHRRAADYVRVRLREDSECRGYDVYRWVFTYDEWRKAHVGHECEVAIDDVDFMFREVAGFHGRINVVTTTASEVEVLEAPQ